MRFCVISSFFSLFFFSSFLFSSFSRADEYHQSAFDLSSSNPLQGSSPLVAPASDSFPWSGTKWNELNKKRIKKLSFQIENLKKKKSKNLILMLGDGMGFSTIAAARAHKTFKYNLKKEDSYLTMETFPYAGISRTYNVDRRTPDSAATSTAYLGGVKANMGTIGVNEKVKFGKCEDVNEQTKVFSIGKKAMEAGKWIGIVTTTRVTHASPAGVYAHVANRDWEANVPSSCPSSKDIAYQLIKDQQNQNIKVILGGGRENFLPNSKGGKRIDSLNLIEEWVELRKNNNQSYKEIQDLKGLNKVDPLKTDYLLGLFQPSHMNYDVERDVQKEPSILEMTRKAMEILNRSPKGYFLFVEGGRIDHAHHNNNGLKALEDTLAFDEAVDHVYKTTNCNETSVVVTADHSHVFTMGGYGLSNSQVLGFAPEMAKDTKPALQLHYGNGPSFSFHRMSNSMERPRKDLTSINVTEKDFQQDSAIWLDVETHGGEDVPIFGSGPWTHLFHSTEEQTFVAHTLMFAGCLGDYQKEAHCFKRISNSAVINSASLSLFLVFLLKYFFI